MEVWKVVRGYKSKVSFYEVSNLGNTRATITSSGKRYQLNQQLSNNGYKSVHIVKDGDSKSKHVLVHRLVLLAFVGPSDLFVNHKDGNKLNNHVDNLEYCTKSENGLHAYRTGLNPRKRPNQIKGSDTWASKLTEDTVKDIVYKNKVLKVTQVDLAKEYGATQSSIWAVLNGWSWGHVTNIPRKITRKMKLKGAE
jgi:hypothetical protein